MPPPKIFHLSESCCGQGNGPPASFALLLCWAGISAEGWEPYVRSLELPFTGATPQVLHQERIEFTGI